MLSFGIEVLTFVAFVNHYFSFVQNDLEMPLFIRVSSIFLLSFLIFFPSELPGKTKSISSNRASILTAAITRFLVPAANQKIRHGVQKVQFMYFAKTISKHSESAKTYANTTRSRPSKRGGVDL